MSKKIDKEFIETATAEAIASTYKPEEAAIIRKFVKDYNIIKDNRNELQDTWYIAVSNKPPKGSEKDYKRLLNLGKDKHEVVIERLKKLVNDIDTNMPLLQMVLVDWARETLHRDLRKEDTLIPVLKHLSEEIDEVIKNPSDLEEFADVLILVLQALYAAGYSVDDWVKAAWKKHYKNLKRNWNEPDKDGVIRHKKNE